MRHSLRLALAGLVVTALGAAAPAQARNVHAVCPSPPTGYAHCHAVVVTDAKGAPLATSGPTGYRPADLQSAYAVASAAATAGGAQTVAIVDAYDNPYTERDLATYRSTFGLVACTTANGCFRKVNQYGGSSMPRGNTSWGQEIALDVDMVSAICPNCHILLVEANTSRFSDLLAAEDYATSHATAVSNSWGGSEFSSETSSTYDGHFNRPLPITVSSGDSGYGAEFPAASRYVTAVGGTTLNRASNTRGWTESAWSGAGSGCSAYETKPTWQTDTGCTRRAIADVAAIADPQTGVSVYDTYGSNAGWLVFGGTSVAAPVVAGVYALAGNGSSAYAGYPYGHTGSLFDVISGSNGSCSGSYLCTAVAGFDGPTGLGTPNGIGAF